MLIQIISEGYVFTINWFCSNILNNVFRMRWIQSLPKIQMFLNLVWIRVNKKSLGKADTGQTRTDKIEDDWTGQEQEQDMIRTGSGQDWNRTGRGQDGKGQDTDGTGQGPDK